MIGNGEASTLKLTISYEGARFAGSQRQAGHRSVQGELESAIAQVAGREISIAMAGRTDGGVHATGQVASVTDVRPEWGVDQYLRSLNSLMKRDCAVQRLERKHPAFHARFDAKWREYRYCVWSGARQPLIEPVCWQRRGELDLDRMRAAAQFMVGTFDFASFAGGGDGVPWSPRQQTQRGTVRTIMQCDVRWREPWWGDNQNGQLVEIQVVADGFLPKMVRTIVGVLVDVGQNKQEPEWVSTLLAERDRRIAGETAPARGLTLWRVGYAGETPDSFVV